MRKNNKDQSVLQKAKDDAFNLLSYRERSEAEVRTRLLKKGYAPDIVEKVVARLKKLDYLNDERFAEKWINYRMKNNPRGVNLLRQELRQKGINNEVIECLLPKLVPRELQIEVGFKLAHKWLTTHSNPENRKRKLMQYLQNKGFCIDDIYSIIDKLGLQ